MKPRLLDLFCGAGGAAMGYHRAGFDVYGVDIARQPHYPFYSLWRRDALEVLQRGRVGPWYVSEFDAIHASPPCQASLRGLKAVNELQGRTYDHPELIASTRDLLRATGLPYVIENVEGAKLVEPVKLCGSSFGLKVQRHRLFECSFGAPLVPPCAHHLQQEAKYWTSWRPNKEPRLAKVVQVYGNAGDSSLWAEAMGIDWMTRDELREAIPPAYTEFIGQALMTQLPMAAVSGEDRENG